MDENPNDIMADTLISGVTLVEKESRSIGDSPIGAIIAWAKNLSGVPNLAEGWVECDGTTLVDALSPLNGQTIPDLNGDSQFIRGNSTSGGTGGAATQTTSLNHAGQVSSSAEVVQQHTVDGSNEIIHIGGGGVNVDILTDVTNSFAIIPPFYNVVWIMRIK